MDYGNHHHREDHKVACGHMKRGRPGGGIAVTIAVRTTRSPAGTWSMAAPQGVVKAIAITIIAVRATRPPAGTCSMAVPMGAMKAMAIITTTRALAVLAVKITKSRYHT